LAGAMAMFMYSLAGVPPFFGFWPKFLVFDAAVKADLTWLAVIGIATSVISAFYYLKIVKTMYFDEPAAPFARDRDVPQMALIALAALFVSPLGYLVIPYLGPVTLNAASALF
ncbi:MAG: nuoN, partial [Alphaproteobacteria bacterium]|nr:nuoN [Alphaproteobacteria bacterium]